MERLREIVSGIKASAASITRDAGEIAAGNANLSGRTEQQAASLEETASAMEQLTATVQQNRLNAETADRLAQDANQIAVRGGELVKRVVITMGDIQQASRKITDIISVIDSIAFQTNILALNAAVEAARAGEQGRGFAVVAAEVPSLAQRSAQAAKEIQGLIQDSVQRVDAGSRLADETGRTMEEIVSSFREVTGLVGEISSASREQRSGIEQVTAAVGRMDDATQRNASLVEQAVAAAESLDEQARALSKAIAIFRIEVHATAHAVALPFRARSIIRQGAG